MSDDERLRAAYQDWLASAPVGDRARCPTPDALRAAAEREGAEAERLGVLDHAMGCPACRA
ncbi:MAG TPA: hypothetical protein VFX50_11530, partial [Gemmatimonadales bacterium]|nr:hypothetical protein [Gemmatimonadales bacterium]